MLIEGGSFSAISGRPICMEPGCRREADFLPKLWVPAVPPRFRLIGVKPYDGCANVMGLPYCRKHFHLLWPAHFLISGELRSGIEAEFAAHGARPAFDRASLHQIRRAEPEFQNWMQMQRLAKAAASA